MRNPNLKETQYFANLRHIFKEVKLPYHEALEEVDMILKKLGEFNAKERWALDDTDEDRRGQAGVGRTAQSDHFECDRASEHMANSSGSSSNVPLRSLESS